MSENVPESRVEELVSRRHGRRDFLKKSAIAGVTVAYAVPLIETLTAMPASAATSPAPICGNCTFTIGYYHASQHCDTINALLARAGGKIVLGDSSGQGGPACGTPANTITVTTCAQVNALTSNPGGGCKQIVAQLLAAKLNFENVSQACQATILAAIIAADQYICSHSDVKAGTCTKAELQAAAALAAPLDTFNNGGTCAPHCNC